MTPDRAILSALNVPSAVITPHGGSGFTSTYKVTCSSGHYFLKTGTGRSAESMFLGPSPHPEQVHH
jgi:hypothetical protein